MTTIHVTKRDSKLYEAVQTALSSDVVTLSTDKGAAVMISEDEWKNIKASLYLTSDPELMKEIRDALNTPLSEYADYK